jgi:hypothetical protein
MLTILTAVPVVLIVLKVLEQGGDVFNNVTSGVNNRLDDPSFWTISGAVIAAFLVNKVASETSMGVTKNYPIRAGALGFAGWALLTAIGSCVYLYAVWKAKEAFWAGTTIQHIEGGLNIYAIVSSYLFVILGFCTVYSTRSPELRANMDPRQQVTAPAWVFSAVFVPLGLIVLLWLLDRLNVVQFLTTFGWTFAPFAGKSASAVVGQFLLFWMWNFFLGIFAFYVWHRDLVWKPIAGLKFLPFVPLLKKPPPPSLPRTSI